MNPHRKPIHKEMPPFVHNKSPLYSRIYKNIHGIQVHSAFCVNCWVWCAKKRTSFCQQYMHSERRAGARGGWRAQITLSCIQDFYRLNVPEPLASSGICPRVKILLLSQKTEQWNRLPMDPFLFFPFVAWLLRSWRRTCCLLYLSCSLTEYAEQTWLTRQPESHSENPFNWNCLYQLHLVLFKVSHSTPFTVHALGKWERGLFTLFFDNHFKGEKYLSHHIR